MKRFLATLCFGLFCSSAAQAHNYYYEVNVDSELKLNEQQQLQHISFTWNYAEDVSKLLLANINLSNKEELNHFGDQLFSDLGERGFFTHIRMDGKDVALMSPKQYILRQKDGKALQLVLGFDLKEPTNIKNKTINLDLIDYDGMALMKHQTIKVPSFCQSEVKPHQTLPPTDDFKHDEPVQQATILCK